MISISKKYNHDGMEYFYDIIRYALYVYFNYSFHEAEKALAQFSNNSYCSHFIEENYLYSDVDDVYWATMMVHYQFKIDVLFNDIGVFQKWYKANRNEMTRNALKTFTRAKLDRIKATGP